MLRIFLLTIAAAVSVDAASAAETVTYTYDALGRVIKVVHSGGPAAGVTTVYSIDNSDNRSNVTTTGGH